MYKLEVADGIKLIAHSNCTFLRLLLVEPTGYASLSCRSHSEELRKRKRKVEAGKDVTLSFIYVCIYM